VENHEEIERTILEILTEKLKKNGGNNGVDFTALTTY